MKKDEIFKHVMQWNWRTRATHDLNRGGDWKYEYRNGKKQKGTFEGGGGVDVSDNGDRFWYLVTILKHKHLVREVYERECH